MNDQMNSEDAPIRITREEAMSSGVDDFLNRQRSLIGEEGIGGDKKGDKWYLQNWFLFGLAGALAAFLVWAFTEPYYDDSFYIQGQIESLDLEDPVPEKFQFGFQEYEFKMSGKGWIKIRDQRIWLSEWVKEYREDGTASLEPGELREGREVGVYLEYFPVTGADGIALASYITLDPPSPPEEKATLSLVELNKRGNVINLLLFPMIAAAIGLLIGAAEGIVCRVYKRAFISGIVGLLVGFVGGMIAKFPGEMLYGVMRALSF